MKTRSGEPESNAASEVQSLRRALRDVVALSALPSTWMGSDLSCSLQNLTDVLQAALRALTVCVQVELPDGSEFSTAASNGLSKEVVQPDDSAELLDAVEPDSSGLVEIAALNGSSPLSALPHPIVLDGKHIGRFVAYYKVGTLPSENDRLLLETAANQVTLLFQRQKDEEERFARKVAEERLRQAEHRYQQLVQSLPAAIYTCDSEGRITLFNEAAVKLWGRRPEIGEDFWCGSWRIFKPDGSSLPLHECPTAIAIREERSVRGQEIIVERPDGTRAWVLPHPELIRDESGKIVGTVNMLVDVSDRKGAEEALARHAHEQAALYHLADGLNRAATMAEVYDTALDGILAALACQRASILLYDSSGSMRFTAWRGLSDHYRQAVEGHSPWKRDEKDPPPICVNDIELAEVPEALKNVVKSEGIQALIFIPLVVNGHLIGKFMAYYDAPQVFTEAKLSLGLTIARQLGFGIEQKRAQQELCASAERVRQLLSLMPAAVYTCDARGRITFFNRRAAELWDREPALGDPDQTFCGSFRLWLPDGSPLPHEETPMAVAVKTGASSRNREVVIERPDGSRITVSVNIDPLYDANGKSCGAINVFQDITDRRQMEDALRESQQAERARRVELETLMEAVPAAVWLAHDPECRRITGNRLGYEYLRVPEGGNLSKTAPPQEQPRHFEVFQAGQRIPDEELPVQKVARTGQPMRDVELEHRFTDGLSQWLFGNVVPLRDNDEKVRGVLATLVDITQHKRAEQRLSVQYLVSRVLVESSSLREAAPAIVKNICQHGGWDVGAFWLIDRPLNALRCLELFHLADAPAAHFAAASRECTFQKGVGLPGQVWTEDRPLWLPELATSSNFPRAPVAVKDGLQTGLAFPIRVTGEVFGVVECFSRRRRERDEAFLEMLDAVGSQIGQFIERKRAEESLKQRTNALEVINRVGNTLAAELDLEKLVQAVTDAGREVTGAEFGAFFYNVKNEKGESYMLYTLSGAPREAFAKFPMPRNTALFGPTFQGAGPVRIDDVLQDPRYGKTGPHFGMPKGHLPVRSYLAASVVSRSGEVLGGLFYGHSTPGVFTDEGEQIISAIAAQAAVAIDNAQLYRAAQRELAERQAAEERLRKRGERLQFLSETLAQLLNAGDPETVVRELFPKVAAHLGMDTYFEFMVSPEGDALWLHSCAGVSDETARSIGRLNFGEAICGTVAQTRQPIHATDIQNTQYDKAEWVRGLGIQCYACNPLIVGDRLLGTLSFASRTRKALDEDELQFLRLISHSTAVALDRLKSAEQLRESEERFRAVVDNSPAVIYVKHRDGRYLLVNERYEQLFHVKESALLGKKDADLFSADVAQQFRDNDLKVIGTGAPLEAEEIAPHDDGIHTYISVKFPLRRADGSIYAVAGLSTDITERKRAEEVTARLAAIVEHSDDAILSTDLNGCITTWNAGAQRLYGYRAEDIIGRPVATIVPEQWHDEEVRMLDQIREGRAIENFETLRRRKDGALIDVSLTISPVKDSKGNVIGISKVARDITDKVRAKEQLEHTVAERTAQLRDTVAELEGFSYSVAHDMRAPLRAMNSYSRVLETEFADVLPPEGQVFAKRIASGAERLDALITDVLNYSKIARSEMTLERVDVEKLTREIVDSYPNFRESGATILIQSPIPPVIGNIAALTQCISNLLSNATKFVAPGTSPRVLVRAEKRDKRVRVWFEDNGIGISEEGRDRIFRLFQRLNPASEFDGTGIGLTIVRKAVERMHGNVGFESKSGTGSQFWIELKGAEQ